MIHSQQCQHTNHSKAFRKKWKNGRNSGLFKAYSNIDALLLIIYTVLKYAEEKLNNVCV